MTRLRVVAAAGALFAEHGYAATTIDAIARAAGVGRNTVFTSVPGGKPELIKPPTTTPLLETTHLPTCGTVPSCRR